MVNKTNKQKQGSRKGPRPQPGQRGKATARRNRVVEDFAYVNMGTKYAKRRVRFEGHPDGGLIMHNSEKVTSIAAHSLGNFNLDTIVVNPGLAMTAPYLSRAGALFDMYHWDKLVYEFRSSKATSHDGLVYLSVDYSPNDDPPESTQDMSQYAETEEGHIYMNRVSVEAKVRTMDRFARARFVRENINPVQTGEFDINTYDACRVYIATEGYSGDPLLFDETVGELWIHYSCHFFAPNRAIDDLGESTSYSVAATQPVGFVDGPLDVIHEETGVNAVEFVKGTITERPSLDVGSVIDIRRAGTWLVTFRWEGASTFPEVRIYTGSDVEVPGYVEPNPGASYVQLVAQGNTLAPLEAVSTFIVTTLVDRCKIFLIGATIAVTTHIVMTVLSNRARVVNEAMPIPSPSQLKKGQVSSLAAQTMRTQLRGFCHDSIIPAYKEFLPDAKPLAPRVTHHPLHCVVGSQYESMLANARKCEQAALDTHARLLLPGPTSADDCGYDYVHVAQQKLDDATDVMRTFVAAFDSASTDVERDALTKAYNARVASLRD